MPHLRADLAGDGGIRGAGEEAEEEMNTSMAIVNSIGLGFDIVGVWFIFYFPFQHGPSLNAFTALAIEGESPAVIEEKRLATRNQRRCRWGLRLMVTGFGLQIASNASLFFPFF